MFAFLPILIYYNKLLNLSGGNYMDANEHLTSQLSKLSLERKKIRDNEGKILTEAYYLLATSKISELDYSKVASFVADDPLYNEAIEKEMDKCFDNLIINRLHLFKLYDEALKLSSLYSFRNRRYDQDDDLVKEAIEFLKYINCYSLYDTLNRKSMIGFGNKDKNVTYNAGDLSYIVLYKNNPGYYMGVTLVHEMGHAFYNNVLKKMISYYPTPIEEIISICFERIFMDYLKDNNLITEENYKKLIESSFSKYDYFVKYEKRVMSLFDDPDNKCSCNKDDMMEITFDTKTGKETYNLNHNHYAFGSIASAKLFMQYLDDKDYFVKHLKDIIHSIYQMSFEQLLDEYGDTKTYGNYLKKTLDRKRNNSV